MAENSHISWTTHTFNTHFGCTKVSEGCKFCYADALSSGRMKQGLWGPTAGRKPMSESYWKQLDRWEKEAARTGVSPRVFCCSMSDLFEGPETCQDPAAYAVVEAARARLFAAIERTSHLLYLLLTKRPENMRKFTPMSWEGGWPANVMAGTSVEDQAAADLRIPKLLAVPTWHFLSMEPLLGPVDLRHVHSDYAEIDALTGDHGVIRPLAGRSLLRIHWVICGGESGPGARPMHPDWVRALRDQCAASQTLFHFKQWGEWLPYSQLSHAQQNAYCENSMCVKEVLLEDSIASADVYRVGKKKAGRMLDGQTHDDVPEFA